MDKNSFSKWNETIYICPQLPEDSPLQLKMAGITHPDPDYRILRNGTNGLFVLEYVVKGRGHIRYGDQKFSPVAGDVYFLQPPLRVEYYSDPDDPWEKVWFNLKGPLVEALCEAYRLKGMIYYHNCPLKDDFYDALQIVRSEQKDLHSRFALQLHRIIVKLSNWRNTHPESRKSPEGICLKEFIDSHWQEKISLRDLAEMIKKSPAQTLRIFKQDWQDSPCSYVQKQRNFYACQYLENTKYPVKVLADLLGFKDEFYFSNWFKQRNGCSPAAYRQKFR